jgi:hypothetical protein
MKKSEKKRTTSRGPKFSEKYAVSAAQIYKGDPGPDKLVIPPKNHFLYDPSAPTVHDELRVQQIDADGEMTDAIEVWTDPDSDVLYVVDGRARLLDVRECNRRREAEGREPVQPSLRPISRKEEKDAVARLTIKNFHRRGPTLSAYALNIEINHRAGWSWDRIVQLLHVESEDPEQWCRKRLPLAFCVPEVREAFDSGEFPLGQARHFGGGAVDGSKALGKKEQLALLAQKRAEKQEASEAPKPKQVTPKTRERIRAALSNGVRENLCHQDQMFVEGIVAALAFVDGDVSAFKQWPDINDAVSAVVKGDK